MKTVVAAALGECVHVAGVSNFLRLAERAGWRTVFLGPAVPVERLLEVARQERADTARESILAGWIFFMFPPKTAPVVPEAAVGSSIAPAAIDA